MRADILIQTQRLMAQTVMGLAKSIENATALRLTPVPFAKLPAPPRVGTLACVSDSSVTTGVITGGGSNIVLAFYNGTSWVVH